MNECKFCKKEYDRPKSKYCSVSCQRNQWIALNPDKVAKSIERSNLKQKERRLENRELRELQKKAGGVVETKEERKLRLLLKECGYASIKEAEIALSYKIATQNKETTFGNNSLSCGLDIYGVYNESD